MSFSDLLSKLGLSAEDAASTLANKPAVQSAIDNTIADRLANKSAQDSAQVFPQSTAFTHDPAYSQDQSSQAMSDFVNAQKAARAVPDQSAMVLKDETGIVPYNKGQMVPFGDMDPTSNSLVPLSGGDAGGSGIPLRDVTPKSASSALPVPYRDISDIPDDVVEKSPILSMLKKGAIGTGVVGAGLGAASLMGGGSGDGGGAQTAKPASVPAAKPSDDDSDDSDDDSDSTPVKKAAPVAKKSSDQTDDMTEADIPTAEDLAGPAPASKPDDKTSDDQNVQPDLIPSQATLAALTDAQNQSHYLEKRNRIDNALNRFGQAIGMPGTQYKDENITGDPNRPLQDLQQKIEMEKQDPNSEYSSNLRDFVKDKVGYDVPEGVSATQLNDTMLKPVVQMFEIQQKAKEAAALKQATLLQQKQIADDKLQGQNDRAHEMAMTRQMMAAMANQNRADHQADKHSNDQFKAQQNWMKADNSFRGNTAVQQAALGLKNSEAAMSIINSVNDYNKLTPEQYNTLTSEISKIATGGAATEASAHDLRAQTLMSNAAKFWQKVGGNPTGAQLGQFVQLNKNYLDDLNRINQRWVDSYRLQNYKGFKDQAPPEFVQDYEGTHPGVMQLLQEEQAAAQQRKAAKLAVPGGTQNVSNQGGNPNVATLSAQYAKMHSIPLDQATAIISKRLGQQ